MLPALLILFCSSFSFLSQLRYCNLVAPISVVDAFLLKIMIERGMTI
jgi:hypothetical protein